MHRLVRRKQPVAARGVQGDAVAPGGHLQKQHFDQAE